MWILDSAWRNGVDLWYRDNGVKCLHHDYDPPFYLYLPDPSAYHEMIDALEEHYRAEACTFRTLFGELDGFSIQPAGPLRKQSNSRRREMHSSSM